jgi:hypothetical protein
MKLSNGCSKAHSRKKSQREESMKKYLKKILQIYKLRSNNHDANFSVEETARLIIEAMKVKGYLLT